MLISRRIAGLTLLFAPNALIDPQRTLPVEFPSLVQSAASGVELAPSREIQKALNSKTTVVVDARGVQEIVEKGYFVPRKARWVNAPCTVDECPLLSKTADNLIGGDKATLKVIVYCASGKRAAKAKEILEALGYRHVLNAGAFPNDLTQLQ